MKSVKKIKLRCPVRAMFDFNFRCTLPKGHRGHHWGNPKVFCYSLGKKIMVKSGFCHGRGERCSHHS